jgi:hypothetical protein
LLTIYFELVLPDAVILCGVPVVLALHLVTHQNTRAQAQTATDRRPSARMADRSANEAACNRAANSTDPSALLTGRQ